MDEADTWAGNLDLIGGRLCLDFANTVDWHASDHPREWLTNYPDLVAWSRHAGALTEAQAQDLARAAEHRSDEAASVLERAITLREAMYRIFSAIVARGEPKATDLAALNSALARALTHLRIAPAGESFAWEWTGEDELDRMLWPVVWSAAELLVSGDLERVRECPGDGCGWLFLDTSRNRTRKWCSMDSCGNRAKARRHYRRTRKRSTEGSHIS
ncbi:MAG: CGNR zinc finger domain-containing protein [Bacillota bacterium]